MNKIATLSKTSVFIFWNCYYQSNRWENYFLLQLNQAIRAIITSSYKTATVSIYFPESNIGTVFIARNQVGNSLSVEFHYSLYFPVWFCKYLLYLHSGNIFYQHFYITSRVCYLLKWPKEYIKSRIIILGT